MAEITYGDHAGFIARWKGVTASELSTSQSFLIDLCRLLDVDSPHPTPEQDYLFERPITFRHGDGSSSAGRIDLYRRGAFVLESKKIRGTRAAKGIDNAMLLARSQAEGYARALPASEGRPPFVVVVDVGNRIELYAEFSRSGATYTPFPDSQHHRIALEDLARDDVRAQLRQLWLDPLSLDPSRESARVTREIARRLAELAKSLEAARHPPELVAQFLMRCLFTMFAEDVRLLPENAFLNLMKSHAEAPDTAMRMLGVLWADMDRGGFSAAIAGDVLRFNGKLFKQPETLPLDKPQLALLIDAAKADWRHVEPAIFGTLLERALSPTERHKLGAHYTPRAYVERLVLPTVIEPLRAEWSDAQAAALTLAAEGRADEAIKELRRFHHRLCQVRVLDPACGSGNFLYVTLEHLKRLEGEVLNALDDLGYRQTGLALGGDRADAAMGETVDPHNLLGIELNPRAAAIAEVVLWIGYLQWHFRTRGNVNPPVPVIRDFHNIENRDAVLAFDRVEFVTDERGMPVTRWDGRTMKPSPVTGEDIPDDSARLPVECYVNPRKAEWPKVDFVVGNPPFIGRLRIRDALGDGYVEALRSVWTDVTESADFVMYWWHKAALAARNGELERFGFITTNSIRQTFNRRVIEAAMAAKLPFSHGRGRSASAETDSMSVPVKPNAGGGAPSASKKPTADQPLSLVFAIPDHPWVDVADGAAVRIAMTVARAGEFDGKLVNVVAERSTNGDEVIVDLAEKNGLIHENLAIGVNVGKARQLVANGKISAMGMILVGGGFIVEPNDPLLQIDPIPIKPYLNGRDLTQKSRGVFVIDLYGLSHEEARIRHPACYQRLFERVKPERDLSKDKSLRESWWLFRRTNIQLRSAISGLERYIGTTETSKHRVFSFIPGTVTPDQKIRVIGANDAVLLAVLLSSLHVTWAAATGARLGAGNDLVYNNTSCFETFPFPDLSETGASPTTSPSPGGRGEQANFAGKGEQGALRGELIARIRSLAEQLDAHRKRQQTAHPELTLTGIYNVLEALREGRVLTAKERVIHEQGLVSVLRQLHDELDAAVLAAYGWSDLLPLLWVAHGLGGGGAAGERAHPGLPPLIAGEGDVGGAGQATLPAAQDEAKRAFDDAVLERLVDLNAERAAEEARGLIRWLRPEFQNPQAAAATPASTQAEIDVGSPEEEADAGTGAKPDSKPLPWPKDPVEQVRAVAAALAASAVPLSADDLASRFSSRGAWKQRLPQLLDMLAAVGRAREQADRRFVAI